jgi:RRXRR protein
VFVYMLNCHGEPLMPCQPRQARLLLKGGQARIVKMVPFTLQLLFGSSGYKQEVSVGIDAGTHHIGVSATAEQKVFFEAQVLPRTDMQELLAIHRQFRRVLNRKKAPGWLAPSVQHKVDGHLKTIRLVHQILPVSRTTIEVAQFDMQKIRHPEIEGYEQAKALFPHVHLTYGYITKQTRITHALEKSHLIDARCISQHPLAVSDGTWYLIKQVRRNNRQLHKATIRKGGKRQRNTAPKYVHGFRLFDCVKYQGTCCFVFGRRSSGYFDLRSLEGTKIHTSASYKKLVVIQRASACLVERRAAFPPVA